MDTKNNNNNPLRGIPAPLHPPPNTDNNKNNNSRAHSVPVSRNVGDTRRVNSFSIHTFQVSRGGSVFTRPAGEVSINTPAKDLISSAPLSLLEQYSSYSSPQVKSHRNRGGGTIRDVDISC